MRHVWNRICEIWYKITCDIDCHYIAVNHQNFKIYPEINNLDFDAWLSQFDGIDGSKKLLYEISKHDKWIVSVTSEPRNVLYLLNKIFQKQFGEEYEIVYNDGFQSIRAKDLYLFPKIITTKTISPLTNSLGLYLYNYNYSQLPIVSCNQ